MHCPLPPPAPPCPVHDLECPLVHDLECPMALIGWNSVVWCGLHHCVCFQVTEPGLCTNTRFVFTTHTEWTASRP